MSIERLMVPGEPAPFSHYCHVVKARGQIFLSGAVGIAPDGSIPESTAAQFELALKSLDNCLRHAGHAPPLGVKRFGAPTLKRLHDRLRATIVGNHRMA